MPQTDVLILGNTLGACTAALKLAKDEIPVTLIDTGPLRPLSAPDGIPLPPPLPEKRTLASSRAHAHLTTHTLRAVEECLPLPEGEMYLQLEEDTGQTLHALLWKQVRENPLITLLDSPCVVDLISLHSYGADPADQYKKPTCLGVYLYDFEQEEIVSYFAKETVIGLPHFLHPFHPNRPVRLACYDAIALAMSAGARIIHLNCQSLSQDEPERIGNGGIPVDTKGQTGVYRLRAVGDCACTGVQETVLHPPLQIVEQMVWAVTTAEDVSLNIKKFLYPFPETTPPLSEKLSYDTNWLESDWKTLQQVVKYALDPASDSAKQKRAKRELFQLQQEFAIYYPQTVACPDLIGLRNALVSATQLIHSR